MIILTLVSLWCLLILVGGYFYTGSTILPQTQNMTSDEALRLWIEWSIIFAIPVVTAVLWTLRFLNRRS